MQSIEKLLKKIEKNFQTKDEIKKEEFVLNGETYEILLPTRSEAMEMLFSKRFRSYTTYKDLYEWLKPYIYKMFQLKEAAVRAKEAGYIKTHYEVIEMVFNPDEIGKVISFIMEKINSTDAIKQEIEFQKKQ